MSKSDSRVTLFAKRAARSLSRRMREFGQVQPEGFDLSNVPSADVALYFPDAPPKLYQLIQWLPIFEANKDVRTIVVMRNFDSYNIVKDLTPLKTILVPRYEDMMAMYDRADFKAVVYVNNGWTNFQSLSFQQAVHVHVNHGESDKICMVSNQAKAYDRVFVAGTAAVKRHEAAIAWFDLSHLVRVGRPQLDLGGKPLLAPSSRVTITYAPTWEGEDAANNYTSVDLYGEAIIAAALAQPNARVIYKPHPRVSISEDEVVLRKHEAIVAAMKAAQSADPSAGHQVLETGDMLDVIRDTDVMIADVSSVSLDHLYLRPQAPLFITDRRNDRDLLAADAPVSTASYVVDASSIAQLQATLAEVIASDSKREERLSMRDYYFDGLGPGESTARFWTELNNAIESHHEAMSQLSRVRT